MENIGAETITDTQWGYLGASDQGITTSSNVEFKSMSLTAQPMTHWCKTATQSIPTSENTIVTWNAELICGSANKPTHNSGVFTIHEDGLYLINYELYFAISDSDGQRVTYITTDRYENYRFGNQCLESCSDLYHVMNGSCVISFYENNTLSLMCYQNSGSSINAGSATSVYYCDISIAKLH